CGHSTGRRPSSLRPSIRDLLDGGAGRKTLCARHGAAATHLNCSESLSRTPRGSLTLSDSLVVFPTVASTFTRWVQCSPAGSGKVKAPSRCRSACSRRARDRSGLERSPEMQGAVPTRHL